MFCNACLKIVFVLFQASAHSCGPRFSRYCPEVIASDVQSRCVGGQLQQQQAGNVLLTSRQQQQQQLLLLVIIINN